jgi:predicted MPP superfamily phosphohydrolase
LVQITDLHIGPRVEDSYLLRAFESVKALSPEIVVYTGDFTSYEANILGHAQRMFSHLPLGQLATFGVLGNHDYGPGWSKPAIAAQVADLAGAAGVRILRNTLTEVAGLQVVGMDDLWADRFDPVRAMATLDLGRASLVLSHNPDTVDLGGWGAYAGWILAGHTHGGQCRPPFLPPPLLPVKNRRYTAGEFRLPGGRKMYISRGVGHLLRVRFNARPEITVFQLSGAV